MRVPVYNNDTGIPCGFVDIPGAVAEAAETVAEWMKQNECTTLMDLVLRSAVKTMKENHHDNKY